MIRVIQIFVVRGARKEFPDTLLSGYHWFTQDTRGKTPEAKSAVLVSKQYNKLSPDVQALLKSTDPTNRMDNFPHFSTVGQNLTDDAVPQPLYYSPQQINLLAHMSCYNIMHDARDMLLSLKRDDANL
jgi:hypothetical protein